MIEGCDVATVAAMHVTGQVDYLRTVARTVVEHSAVLSAPPAPEGESAEVAGCREAVAVLRMLATTGGSMELRAEAAAALPSSDYVLVTRVLAYQGRVEALEEFAARIPRRSRTSPDPHLIDDAFEHWYSLAIWTSASGDEQVGRWWSQCPEEHRDAAREAVRAAAEQAAPRLSPSGANRAALRHVRAGEPFDRLLSQAVREVSSPEALIHLYWAGEAPGTPQNVATWAERAIMHPNAPREIANHLLATAGREPVGSGGEDERVRRMVRAAGGAYMADLDYPLALLLADPARWWVLIVEQGFHQGRHQLTDPSSVHTTPRVPGGQHDQWERNRDWSLLIMSEIEMAIEERAEGRAEGNLAEIDEVLLDQQPMATRAPFVERLAWIAEHGAGAGFSQVLVAAAAWPDIRVRRAVAKNPQIPQVLLLEMVNDPDRWVRRHAGMRFLDALSSQA